ncbi:MAG: YigZ family protein [Bacteroidota bacterium]|nr:YigZ family protein [Bacteroidota bacterium]
MPNDDTYQTLASVSQSSYRDRASKFYGFAYPVTTEDEVKEILASIRKKYHDANHYCYAYRLGYDNPAIRMNDDGEPSGSAGKPIYGQILSKDITNVLIVVVRYFGGTKLGIPGLIQAFRTAAREAIESNTIVTRTLDETHTILFPYPVLSQVMKIIKEDSASILNQKFDQQCSITFTIRKSLSGKILGRLERVAGLETDINNLKSGI